MKQFLIACGMWWFLLTSLAAFRILTDVTNGGDWEIQVGLLVYAASVIIGLFVGVYYMFRRGNNET